jgi:hypothetical protein
MVRRFGKYLYGGLQEYGQPGAPLHHYGNASTGRQPRENLAAAKRNRPDLPTTRKSGRFLAATWRKIA